MEKSNTDWQAWGVAVAAWLIPGAGHLLQKKLLRGVLLGGIVWGVFALGKYWGGHFYPLLGSNEPTSSYLEMLWGAMNLGMGATYLLSYATGLNFVENARLVTFEYGDTFMKLAGLFNYLLMLDAFDIKVGRKS
jgi:hypothetical protein